MKDTGDRSKDPSWTILIKISPMVFVPNVQGSFILNITTTRNSQDLLPDPTDPHIKKRWTPL